MAEALNRMLFGGIWHLPVTGGDAVVGMVSMRDLARSIAEHRASRRAKPHRLVQIRRGGRASAAVESVAAQERMFEVICRGCCRLVAVGCPQGNEAELGRYGPQLPYDGAVQREPLQGRR